MVYQQRVFNLVEYRGLDLELFFVTEILRLRSLHYGYWENTPGPQDLTLKNLRFAQSRFTERLLSCIPENVSDVLDVGAGIGDNAIALTARNYRVTAISPDRNHARYFVPLLQKGIDFYPTTFENFRSPKQFDLIFISEALNYIDRKQGLEQCRKFTKSNGYLLVAAMFRSEIEQGYSPNFSANDLAYVQQAKEYGFSLLQSIDITPNVLPTMEMTYRYLVKPIRPIFFLLRYTLGTIFSKSFEKLETIWHYYNKRINPDYFARCIRYMFLLFQRTA